MTLKPIDKAYVSVLRDILHYGTEFDNTLAIFNYTIELDFDDFVISIPERKFSLKYAEAEWKWYLEGSNDLRRLEVVPPIWHNMHAGDYIVNSNYGYQWRRNDQLNKVINMLKTKKNTRRAVVTLYDGKEIDSYAYDTPCTMNVAFYIIDDYLHMTVTMRSNDVWYGLPYDAYSFRKLQQLVAEQVGVNVGDYTHFVVNLHLYKEHFDIAQTIIKKYRVWVR